MTTIFFSIIIPVYNVEKYIERAINSVVNQQSNYQNYEIIVVDDGSPDNSVEIIKRLQDSSPQISLISQENKGLGGARNTGVKNARGKFVLFLDADDVIVDGVLSDFEEILTNLGDIDVLEYSASNMTEDGVVLSTFEALDSGSTYTGIEYIKKFESIPSACNKLYNTEFLKNNGLLFVEKMYIEDFEFNTRSFFMASKIYSVNKLGANFIQTPNSITRNTNINTQKKVVYDILRVIKEVGRFEKENTKNTKEHRAFFGTKLTSLNVNITYQILKYKLSVKILKEIKRELLNNGLYVIEYKLKNRSKNIFRLVMKYSFSIIIVLVLFRSLGGRRKQ